MQPNQERRQYRRVPAHLNLLYEIIAPAKLDEYVRLVQNQAPSREDLEIEADRFWRNEDVIEKMQEQFNHITRFMEQINAKLDYLIALNEGTEQPEMVRPSASVTSLSGAGLSFADTRSLPMGSYLKMRVQFSRFPLREILCVGRVVRIDHQADGMFDIGIKYESIHEDDRERIFRYISRVERKMLRERKDAANF